MTEPDRPTPVDPSELGFEAIVVAPCEDDRVRRAAVPLLALTVGLVLADSAVVTLALPDILQRLGGTVAQVAWVLIAFNLVLALVVLAGVFHPASIDALAEADHADRA